MRSVIVDISKIDNLNCGLGQFSYHLSKEIALLNNDVYFYFSPKVTHAPSVLKNRFIPSSKLHRKLPFFSPKAQLWHAIHQDCDLYPADSRMKGVLTIHDLNYLSEEEREDKKKRYLKKLQQKIDKSVAVVFISEFTKKEVSSRLSLKDKLLRVIPNGISLLKTAELTRPAQLNFDDGSFYFGISTVVPKKNYELLVDLALQKKDAKFVIAGDLFHDYATRLQKRVIDEGLQDRFVFLGKVSESEKNYLYKNCKAFVHPSLLEGFGLPLVEALFYGKAVLCSNLCSMPEVVGEHGFYFDPMKIGSVVEAFEQFEAAEIDSAALVRRGENFSWEKAAKAYCELYQEILSGHQD